MIELKGYDWEAVFGFVNGKGTYGHSGSVSAALGDAECPTDSFDIADVSELMGASEGENDGANWLCVVKLKDGRWAFVSAGCDYTGWDCQSGGSGIVSRTLEHLLRFGIGDDDRARLGL